MSSSSLEAGQTTANVCWYTMTVGSRTVDLPGLAFLAGFVPPGEVEGNRKFLCAEVGLDGRSSVYAERSKIPVAITRIAGVYLSTETNLVLIRDEMREEFGTALNLTHTHTHTHAQLEASHGLASGALSRPAILTCLAPEFFVLYNP